MPRLGGIQELDLPTSPGHLGGGQEPVLEYLKTDFGGHTLMRCTANSWGHALDMFYSGLLEQHIHGCFIAVVAMHGFVLSLTLASCMDVCVTWLTESHVL